MDLDRVKNLRKQAANAILKKVSKTRNMTKSDYNNYSEFKLSHHFRIVYGCYILPFTFFDYYG